MKTKIQLFLITLLIACLEPSHNAHAVTPPPDGGYPGGNTAEGDNALLGITSGSYNTAVGFLSLQKNSEGQFNTAVGALALLFNTANENTAIGAGALLRNAPPLSSGGIGNTADGAFALCSNTRGSQNTAVGDRALFGNTTANFNTAIGSSALSSNTTGAANTAIGTNALANSTTGNGNIALGSSAGSNVTTASNVICIGSPGSNGFNNACFISNIFGVSGINGVQMYINSAGRVGAPGSSQRFKEDIKPMERASEVVFALKPVTFRYKKELDPQGVPQFGLVAEDVERVNPALVVRDNEGKIYSVRYDQINAMLLNEFLKEHRTVEELKKEVAMLTATVKEQSSLIQKVSAQLEMSKPAPQTVLNNP